MYNQIIMMQIKQAYDELMAKFPTSEGWNKIEKDKFDEVSIINNPEWNCDPGFEVKLTPEEIARSKAMDPGFFIEPEELTPAQVKRILEIWC